MCRPIAVAPRHNQRDQAGCYADEALEAHQLAIVAMAIATGCGPQCNNAIGRRMGARDDCHSASAMPGSATTNTANTRLKMPRRRNTH